MPRTVEEWLTSIRLEEYADAFNVAGLTTMVKVAQMTEADLGSFLSPLCGCFSVVCFPCGSL